MAVKTTLYTVEGFDKLEKQLRGLGEKVGKKVLRAAVKEAAETIRKAAQDKVPFNYGLLRESISISVKRIDTTAFAVVGPISMKEVRDGVTHNPARYAHLVEFGTSPHVIHAKPGKWLVFKGKFAKKVNHPGQPARSFMRYALDTTRDAVITKLGELLAEGITREAEEGAA